MSKKVDVHQRFIDGISDFPKEGPPDSFSFAQSVDVRSDPRSISILPRTEKTSSTTYLGLNKWFIPVPNQGIFGYDDSGRIYQENPTWSMLRDVADSHGNGMTFFAEDGFLYYTNDTTIGRYGPLNSNYIDPQFYDDFLGAQGGVPQNTNSIDLEASSSQYLNRADTATLSITGDLAIEAWISPESLPAVGSDMTLVSKWDESGATRSYRFDIVTISGYFGNGSDGILTISSNTTEAPIDSSCSGTSGATSLTATNASFAAGQVILIHQTRGTGAGTWQRNTITSYSAGTIGLDTALNANYTTSGSDAAQVRVLKQYSGVTVQSGFTYSAKAWDGTVGGILGFLCNGLVDIVGTMSASEKGYRAGAGGVSSPDNNGQQAEGTTGAGGTRSISANGTGGGGGQSNSSGGGGGGHAASGSNGGVFNNSAGVGGSTSGNAALTTLTFGGGGGGGGYDFDTGPTNGSTGGAGGGGIFCFGATITVTGAMASNGGNGGSNTNSGGGGGGAGGSILLKCVTATLGTGLVTASAGTGGDGQSTGDGGNGSVGRIHIDYLTSFTGTTSPTIDSTQDNTLVTTTSYLLRLSISSDGSNYDLLTELASLNTSGWQHVAVSWDASESTAEFFLNGVSQGTSVGLLTAISNNGSDFSIGAYENSGGSKTAFYDGLIDEVRLWSVERSAAEIVANLYTQIDIASPGLNAYYKLNATADDATANANNLTAVNTPVYSSMVPFSSPSTRLDIDQQATTSGQTYTVPSAINENAQNRLTFTPEVDPQKSISVLIASKGTATNWTLTVHDQYNNVIATSTAAVANLIAASYYEFVFTDVWRPLINNQYHFHITSDNGTGTVTTGTTADLETVSYRTHFQFLVEDDAWHPIAQFLNFLVIGNGRYIAKIEAGLYYPNLITLPSGYNVRCLGFWREYLAIGTVRGTDASAITENDNSRIYFWDGTATYFNFFIEVPEGAINSILGAQGQLYFVAGYLGDLMLYEGGDRAVRIKRLPKVSYTDTIEVYPGGMAMWQSLLRYAPASISSGSDVPSGVYTWGKTNPRYNDALTFDYPISTGDTDYNVGIGSLIAAGSDLNIGWKDGSTYGIDEVANDSTNFYPTAYIEFLITSAGDDWKEKRANGLVARFDPLVSGQSLNLSYQIDQSGTWNYLGSVSTVGKTLARQVIGGKEFFDIQTRLDLATSTTSPKVHSLTLEFDGSEDEKRV